VTDRALYRTKINLLEQTTVVLPGEKKYHTSYYLIFGGLTAEELARLSLEAHSVKNLRYLNRGDTQCNQTEDSQRLTSWKTCLVVLGTPFLDAIHVLTGALLLSNLQFHKFSTAVGSQQRSSKLFMVFIV
jgi:dachs protein